MALDYEKFMMKQTQWRGEVTAKLENINNDVSEIKNNNKEFHKEMREEIRKLQKQISNTNARVAGIAGTISIIIVIVGTVINVLLV